MSMEEKLKRLFAVIIEAADRDAVLRRDLEALLVALPAPNPLPEQDSGPRSPEALYGPARPKNRRKPAAFDPYVAFEESPAGLQERLGQLDIEQLRDMVAEYAMDPSKLVSKWKAPQRIAEHILETVKNRLSKGDAFRR